MNHFKDHPVKISTILKFVFSIIVIVSLYFYFRSVITVNDLIGTIGNISIVEILILIALNILLALLKAYNWKSILKYEQSSDMKFSHFLFPIFAAAPLNLIIPAKGGEIIRFINIKNRIPISKCFGSILFERLIDLGCLTTISLIGILILNTNLFIAITLSLMLAIIVGFTFLIMHANIFEFLTLIPFVKKNNFDHQLKQFQSFFFSVKKRKLDVSIFILISLSQWIVTIFQSYLILIFISAQVNLSLVTFIVPVGILLSLIPVSIGGIGTREAAFLYLFNGIISSEKILIFAMIFFIVRYLFPGIVGIPFLLKLNQKEEDNIK